MAKQYGRKLKWAIAGRRKEALEAIRQDILMEYKSLKDIPIVIADVHDEASIDAMTAQTTVLISTAGMI